MIAVCCTTINIFKQCFINVCGWPNTNKFVDLMPFTSIRIYIYQVAKFVYFAFKLRMVEIFKFDSI